MIGRPDGPLTRDALVPRIRAHPLGHAPAEQRVRFADLVWASPEADDPLICNPDGEAAEPTIVHFHGGGYVFGSPATHDRLGRGLAAASECPVHLPPYPLAPEHPWPAQLDAAIAVCAAVKGPLILSGDSAGGHLALVTALALARAGAKPAGLILMSPNTDRSGLSTTRARNDPLDPMVEDAGDRALAALAFGDRDPRDPQLSPVLDDLALLPPTHMEVGRDEVLLDDSLILFQRAEAAGVSIRCHVDPDGLHMGQLWTPWWPVANASLERVGEFVRHITS